VRAYLELAGWHVAHMWMHHHLLALPLSNVVPRIRSAASGASVRHRCRHRLELSARNMSHEVNNVSLLMYAGMLKS
jgi:hypothetical protein